MKPPYLEVVKPRMMKGGPKSTIFGALGEAEMTDPVRSLGGLIEDTKVGRMGKGVYYPASSFHNTERKILGKPAKTHIPGCHYGQVPYAGYYLAVEGKKL